MFNKKNSNNTNLTVKFKISGASGAQNINIIKPSIELNIQNGNNGNKNYVNVNSNTNNNNNQLGGNSRNIENFLKNFPSGNSRNVDNFLNNNQTEFLNINKMSTFKQTTDKVDKNQEVNQSKDNIKKKIHDIKLKSSSTNQKNVNEQKNNIKDSNTNQSNLSGLSASLHKTKTIEHSNKTVLKRPDKPNEVIIDLKYKFI